MLNLGVTMIGWSGLYIGFSWRQELEAEKERALRADALATEARLQMLRYQINPHFLFNALNAVRALIDENPPGARRMVTQLAEFFRFSLVHGQEREASLADELEAIGNYLAIQKTRFDDHLDVSIEIDPSVGDMRLPAFLIHPLVENAVKYGMETSPMPLRIRLAARLVDGHLTVEVANTGRWLDPERKPAIQAEGTGTGLHNIRGRLAMLRPGRHRFDIRERDGWVTAILDLTPGPA
jgi:LytS/YehU family sensor histidine kinase